MDHEPSLAPGSVNRGSRHGRRAVAWIGVAIAGAAVLSLLLLAVAASSIGVSGGIGQRTYRPTTAAEIRPDYRVGVGELLVDLRAVTAASLTERTSGATLSIAGRVGTGHLVVLLPPGVRTHVMTHAGAGEVAIGADTTSGTGVDRELTVDPPAQASSAPVIDLTLGIGVGRIEVRSAE